MHCKEFEYNSRYIELGRLPKIRPHTKHINIVFHQLREYVRKGLIHIHQVSTDDQYADARTRPFPQNVLLKHHRMIFDF